VDMQHSIPQSQGSVPPLGQWGSSNLSGVH
jgi:hypothetical protein